MSFVVGYVHFQISEKIFLFLFKLISLPAKLRFDVTYLERLLDVHSSVVLHNKLKIQKMSFFVHTDVFLFVKVKLLGYPSGRAF